MVRRPGKMEALSEQVEDWYKRARHDLDKARDDLERGWYPIHVFTPTSMREDP
ncbi:MAG: HEPN domain-containing protein [Candidatus Bathyarchaeia archaeon]